MQPGNGLVDPEVVMRLAELRIDLLCHSLAACLRVCCASISPLPRGCVSLLYYILDYKYIIYSGTWSGLSSDLIGEGQAKAPLTCGGGRVRASTLRRTTGIDDLLSVAALEVS